MLATHSKGWTCTAWLPPSCMLSCSQSPMALKKLIKMWLAIIHIKLSIFEVLVLFSKIRLRLLKLSLPLQVLLIIEIFNILVLFALLACGPLASFDFPLDCRWRWLEPVQASSLPAMMVDCRSRSLFDYIFMDSPGGVHQAKNVKQK